MNGESWWTMVLAIIAMIVGSAGHIVRAHIAARRDIELAQLALRDAAPTERPEILEKLAPMMPLRPVAGREPLRVREKL